VDIALAGGLEGSGFAGLGGGLGAGLAHGRGGYAVANCTSFA
jgi:hypothetical protein